MKAIFHDIVADEIFLYALGDVHIGDRSCDLKTLRKYLEWINAPNRYIILMGDWLNSATRESKSDPLEQELILDEQKDLAHELLEPFAKKGRILSAIRGNHENRLRKAAGSDPMRDICLRLSIPYLGAGGVTHIRVGSRALRKTHYGIPNYIIYSHHTTGGGGKTIGGKINRVQMLGEIFPAADVYIGAHNHFEAVGKTALWDYDVRKRAIYRRDRAFMCSGSFLEWNKSYAEDNMMLPSSVGTPRIHLSGKERQMQVTLFLGEEREIGG